MKPLSVFALVGATAAVTFLVAWVELRPATTPPAPSTTLIENSWNEVTTPRPVYVALAPEPPESDRIVFRDAANEVSLAEHEALGEKLKETVRALAVAESALRKKDERIASLEMDLRISEKVREDLRNLPPGDCSTTVVAAPPSPRIDIPASEIRGGEQAEATTGRPWQYPQPINPTDWIQQTLTPPPTGAEGAWDRIRGR
jgi:hypothetical protein